MDASNELSLQESTLIPDRTINAQLAQLDDLKAQATLKYSVKDYDAAAELFSQATELQAQINGEMAAENADLLYLYGRCLYHVAVANSDVLGSKVAGERRQDGPSRSRGKRAVKENGTQTENTADQERVNKEVVKKTSEGVGPSNTKGSINDGKPFFQFTGDENFDDSEEEDDGPEGDAGDGEDQEDEDDDFVNAYEVLDLARVLLLKRLEESQQSKGKEGETSAVVKHLKERLADTHDLQAEIALEGERFPNAVVDLRAALALKEELFPPESSLIAETHYKLSLALEFCSVTQEKFDSEGTSDKGEATVDEDMREEAAKEMEAAIASCKLRIQKEEANLRSEPTEPKGFNGPNITQVDVNEVKEMVTDMEQRLVELRQPPISVNDPTGTSSAEGANPLSGILGSILGESDAAQKAKLEQASKGANDLTGLVKRKKVSQTSSPQPAAHESPKMNGKRKVEFDEEVIEVGTGKKARLEDGDEEQ